MAKEKSDVKPGLTELPQEHAPSAEDMHQAVEEIARLRGSADREGAGPGRELRSPRGLRCLCVRLQDCPIGHVTAGDGHEAVKKYRKQCGILHTAHEFEACELSPELAEADATEMAGNVLHKKVLVIP